MKYRCMTPGCAKFGVVYATPSTTMLDYSPGGNGEVHCTLCGEICDVSEGVSIAPEPMPEPTNYSMVATCQCEYLHHHGQRDVACLNSSNVYVDLPDGQVPVCGDCVNDHYIVVVKQVPNDNP